MANVAVLGADPDRRALLRGLLHLQHHRVVAEGEGLATLREIADPGSVDLLVVDSAVAGGRWSQVIRSATRERPGLRVILVTEAAGRQVARAAAAAGASAVLRRPFMLQEFLAALDQPLTRSGAYRSASTPRRTRARPP
jgi:DNA-binding NtrC family response regulator